MFTFYFFLYLEEKKNYMCLFFKQVQTEVIQQRHKEKREMMASIKKYRKGMMMNLMILY